MAAAPPNLANPSAQGRCNRLIINTLPTPRELPGKAEFAPPARGSLGAKLPSVLNSTHQDKPSLYEHANTKNATKKKVKHSF